MTCTVEQFTSKDIIDVPVTLNVMLIDPSHSPLNTMIVESYQNYTISVIIDSFSRSMSGMYSCVAEYDSMSNNPFIIQSNELEVITRITVGGWLHGIMIVQTKLNNIRLFAGVYILFNGTRYPNSSVIPITDIGESNPDLNNALQCITDKMPCCDQQQLGEWVFPNGTVVPDENSAISFYTNRGQNDGTVNLNRLSDSLRPFGRFCCTIPDAVDEVNYICVTLNGTESDETRGEKYYCIRL